MCTMRSKNIFICNITSKQNNHTITMTKLLFKLIVNNVPTIQVNNELL